jgi:L-threonylcarbamoyladenylate synthase
MTNSVSTQFIAAWQAGKICLHPTDTLPGLSVDPLHPQAVQALKTFKHKASLRTFISLVPDLSTALVNWLPLPAGWQERLSTLWPGPLSVVWQASSQAPAAMVGEDGSIALRCPQFSLSEAWMLEVLRGIKAPLPTSSVNHPGELPCTRWAEARAFALAENFYVPALKEAPVAKEHPALASTLIRLHPDGGYTLLRQGALRITT